MNTIKDGGPAFPIPILPGELWNHELYGNPNGMTLRDWFAGMALAGEIASSNTELSCQATAIAAIKDGRTVQGQIAWNCYDIADAMIAAREGKEDK